MHQLLEWSAAAPSLFYLFVLSVLGGFLVLVVLGDEKYEGKRRFEITLLLAAAVTLFAWRWPMFLWPDPLNIDEGSFTAGAMRATVDFAPWRGFDPITNGPLNAYVLAIPALFGGRIDFFSTRVIGLCLVVGAIWALYFTAKWTFGSRVGQLSIVPPVVFFSMTTLDEFVHCSSEHFPIFLTTAGLAAAARLASDRGNSGSRRVACVVGGVCLGGALFTKLQAVPIAAVVFVLLIAAIVWTRQKGRSALRTELLIALLASATIPSAILISLLVTGEWSSAFGSYSEFSLDYIRRGKPVGPGFFFATSKWYTAFLSSSLLVLVIGTIALTFRKRFSRRGTVIQICALLLLAAVIYAICKPHRPWPHYLLFSVIPISVYVAVILGLTNEARLWAASPRIVAGVVAALFALPLLSIAVSSEHPYLIANPVQLSKPQTDAIMRHAPPGTHISVWGWMPQYFVQTQTIPATRSVETSKPIDRLPHQEYHRALYLAEVQAAQPKLFVDAVALGSWRYRNVVTEGLESFPALTGFIQSNYILKENVEGVRIFVRK